MCTWCGKIGIFQCTERGLLRRVASLDFSKPGFEILAFLNTFGLFWKSKKARLNVAFSGFFNQKDLALEKRCLSCIFITNLF